MMKNKKSKKNIPKSKSKPKKKKKVLNIIEELPFIPKSKSKPKKKKKVLNIIEELPFIPKENIIIPENIKIRGHFNVPQQRRGRREELIIPREYMPAYEESILPQEEYIEEIIREPTYEDLGERLNILRDLPPEYQGEPFLEYQNKPFLEYQNKPFLEYQNKPFLEYQEPQKYYMEELIENIPQQEYVPYEKEEEFILPQEDIRDIPQKQYPYEYEQEFILPQEDIRDIAQKQYPYEDDPMLKAFIEHGGPLIDIDKIEKEIRELSSPESFRELEKEQSLKDKINHFVDQNFKFDPEFKELGFNKKEFTNMIFDVITKTVPVGMYNISAESINETIQEAKDMYKQAQIEIQPTKTEEELYQEKIANLTPEEKRDLEIQEYISDTMPKIEEVHTDPEYIIDIGSDIEGEGKRRKKGGINVYYPTSNHYPDFFMNPPNSFQLSERIKFVDELANRRYPLTKENLERMRVIKDKQRGQQQKDLIRNIINRKVNDIQKLQRKLTGTRNPNTREKIESDIDDLRNDIDNLKINIMDFDKDIYGGQGNSYAHDYLMPLYTNNNLGLPEFMESNMDEAPLTGSSNTHVYMDRGCCFPSLKPVHITSAPGVLVDYFDAGQNFIGTNI